MRETVITEDLFINADVVCNLLQATCKCGR